MFKYFKHKSRIITRIVILLSTYDYHQKIYLNIIYIQKFDLNSLLCNRVATISRSIVLRLSVASVYDRRSTFTELSVWDARAYFELPLLSLLSLVFLIYYIKVGLFLKYSVVLEPDTILL